MFTDNEKHTENIEEKKFTIQRYLGGYVQYAYILLYTHIRYDGLLILFQLCVDTWYYL